MPRGFPNVLLRLLRGTAEDGPTAALTDRALVRRFLAARDEACFQTLVRRHGPMVLGVCRAVLRNEADAEDAFQATFLVLAAKAEAASSVGSLGGWLHGVAYRTALRARTDFARRRAHEGRAGRPEAVEEGWGDATWAEVEGVLHEELARLGEAYRGPLVLCYLQGKTQAEAARLLGLAKGTLKGRLERGRALLAARLVRRGLGPAAVLALAAWPTAPAPVSAAVEATVRAAGLVAEGREVFGVIPDRVSALERFQLGCSVGGP